MSVLCLDYRTGKILIDRVLFENQSVQPDFHITNSYASPTPVIEGDQVFVHFGAYGTAALDRKDGSIIWQRRDLPCNHYRGAGSSPIIYGDLLIFHMDGFDHQYAVALDRMTGKTVWKKDRDVDYGTDNGDYYKAFSTPILIRVGESDQLISPASMVLVSLDPKSGKEIWRVRYKEHSTTVRPAFDGQRLFVSTGFGKAQMLCVRTDGQGDVTATHVDWIQSKGIGSKPSPVWVAGRLFDITDDGVICRLDPATGEVVWKSRLGGKFSASLVASNEHIVALDHDGKGYVFSVADEPTIVSENVLAEGCNASPAIFGNELLIRTNSALYRIAGGK
jgi:outer membrane protein assembly factor BamB